MKIHEQFTAEVKVALTTFQVEGCHRDWNPLPGHTPPEGTVWEAHTDYLNRKIVAAGGTKAEVLERLEQHLRYYMERGF